MALLTWGEYENKETNISRVNIDLSKWVWHGPDQRAETPEIWPVATARYGIWQTEQRSYTIYVHQTQ